MAHSLETKKKLAAASKRHWESLPEEEKAARRKKLSEAQKARWAKLSPEAKANAARGLRAGTYERTTDYREAASRRMKALYASGVIRFQDKLCAHCGEAFAPNSGIQVYCSDECSKAHRTLKTYRLTKAAYDQMLADQNGGCFLCGATNKGWGGKDPKRNTRPLVVDHCHRTGKVRALLCSDCNTALGRFQDDPYMLQRAIDYLTLFDEQGFDTSS